MSLRESLIAPPFPDPQAPPPEAVAGGDRELPDAAAIPWKRELFEVFLRNQLRLAPVIPLVVVALSIISAPWYGWASVIPWLFGAVGAHAIQLWMCWAYFRPGRNRMKQREWVGMLTASEALQGLFLVLPLYLFWPDKNPQHTTFLVASVMAVAALRFLVVNNFMPVLIAGTALMILGAALRCISEFTPFYASLGGILILLELFFLFVARQLQEIARDMLIFRHQKDMLIAELRQARDAAEAERKKAQRASEAKTTFLANMSHELRTPLNAILGFSEILQRELFGPMTNHAYKDYAGDINSSGRYLLGLINDILDVSRIEAGRRDMAEEPVSLEQILENAMGLSSLAAAQKSIQIHVDVAPGTPRILADQRAIQQVAINLTTNAVKFTPRGGHVELAAERLSDGRIKLSVADDGPGIPADEIDFALSAFARGKLATTKAIDGIGLGLSIVNGIMQLHGGIVEIDSKIGRGTSVTCVFPARRVLSGPRSALEQNSYATDTQRRLVNLTA